VKKCPNRHRQAALRGSARHDFDTDSDAGPDSFTASEGILFDLCSQEVRLERCQPTLVGLGG
jgi:hypothetical protein